MVVGFHEIIFTWKNVNSEIYKTKFWECVSGVSPVLLRLAVKKKKFNMTLLFELWSRGFFAGLVLNEKFILSRVFSPIYFNCELVTI